jgi:AcrR family transcriptional regulator
MKQKSNKPTKSLRERNKERVRQEIVECGLRLFQERGFESVSVEMICEEVGISRATFFNYFPQKEMIFMSIAEERNRGAQEFLSSVMKEDGGYTYQHIIKLFVTAAIENERDSKRVKYILQQMLQRPSLWEMAHQSRLHVEDLMLFILKNMKKHGEPLNDKYSATESAKYITMVYFATVLEWLTTPDSPDGWLAKQVKVRLQMAANGVLKSKEE